MFKLAKGQKPGRGDRAATATKLFTLMAVISAAATFVGSGLASSGTPTKAHASVGQAGTGKPIPGLYIVTVRADSNPRSVAAIAHASPKFVYEHALNGFTAELNEGQLNALQHNPAVAAIEPDQQVVGSGWLTQWVDTFGQPWGLDRIDQRTRPLSSTYTYWSNAGYGVRAYIIDSGIATANSDFGGRAQNVFDVFRGNGQDCHGHGTHVAGTVGGARYGVAKATQLLGVRVLDCTNRGSLSGIIAGIDWVRAYALKPAVTNISIEAGLSTALNNATTNLVNSGMFVAVAAGNAATNACGISPASAPGTVTVGASDASDTRASFSNYGACVDLYAPGVNIKSDYLNGGTTSLNGTSMATPHVAGVAALLQGDWGYQTPATLRSLILDGATPNVINSNISGTPNRLLYMSGW